MNKARYIAAALLCLELVFGVFLFRSSETVFEVFPSAVIASKQFVNQNSLDQQQGAAIIDIDSLNKDLSTVLSQNTKAIAVSLKPDASTKSSDQKLITIDTTNISNQRFSVSKPVTDDTTVFMRYDSDLKQLVFYIELVALDVGSTQTQKEEKILKTIPEIGEDYLVQVGRFYSDYVKNIDKGLGLPKKIFTETGVTLQSPEESLPLENGDFSKGLWQDQVNDCSDYEEGEARLGMSLETDGQGSNELLLRSNNHAACTNTTFRNPLKQGELYSLSFNYQSLEGEKMRVAYRFVEKGSKISFPLQDIFYKQQPLTETVVTDEEFRFFNWEDRTKLPNSYSIILEPKKDYDGIDFYVYAPSNGEPEVKKYSNFKLQRFSKKLEIAPLDISETVVSSKNSYDFPEGKSIVTPLPVKSENLLGDSKSVLDKSFWPSQPANCSGILSEVPEMSIEYKESKKDNSITSFVISSKKRLACVARTFVAPIGSENTYTFSFESKCTDGGKARYYFRLFNSRSDKGEVRYGSVNCDSKTWTRSEITFTPQINGADRVNLLFYAPASFGRPSSVEYRNPELLEVAPNDISNYLLSANNTTTVNTVPRVERLKSTASKQVFKVSGAVFPFVFAFANTAGNFQSIKNQPGVSPVRLLDGSSAWAIDPAEFCSQVKCSESGGAFAFEFRLLSKSILYFALQLIFVLVLVFGLLFKIYPRREWLRSRYLLYGILVLSGSVIAYKLGLRTVFNLILLIVLLRRRVLVKYVPRMVVVSLVLLIGSESLGFQESAYIFGSEAIFLLWIWLIVLLFNYIVTNSYYRGGLQRIKRVIKWKT